MSDSNSVRSRAADRRGPTGLERFFDWVGRFGYLFTVPTVLVVLGYPETQEWLTANLGIWTDASVFNTLFLILFGLRVIFGSGRSILPLLLAAAAGLLLFGAVVEISWLAWWSTLVSDSLLFARPAVTYLVALAIPLVGIFLSHFRRVGIWVQLFLLVVVPVSTLVLVNWYNLVELDSEMRIAVRRIDRDFLRQESIRDFIRKINDDESINPEEQQRIIEELQQQIERFKRDQQILERLRLENREYQDQLLRMQKTIREMGPCSGVELTEERVTSYADAVLPETPCVRDFAVQLASEVPGAYLANAAGGPTETGLRQIVAIHRYLAGSWAYVNDPTVQWFDFYSPADRSIALGLAGDCDDFAVVSASLVAAIGGRVRIVHGACSEGYHAWSEVYIGRDREWRMALRVLREQGFSGLASHQDMDGSFWLSMDWDLGQFTCAERDVVVQYTR